MIASTICVVGVYCYATMVTVGMQPLWKGTSLLSMSVYRWIAFPVSVPPALEKGQNTHTHTALAAERRCTGGQREKSGEGTPTSALRGE